jgi:O-antigen/teichoic acid export membrane protein
MLPIKSISSQWLSTVYVAGISTLLTFVFARMLGPEEFGQFSYLATIASLFAIFQDGGFRIFILKEFTTSTFHLNKTLLVSTALRQNTAITLAGIVFILFVFHQQHFLLVLAFISFGLGTTTNFISSQLKGLGKFSEEAWWRILVRTITAITIVGFFLSSKPNIKSIFSGWILGYIIALAFRLKDFKNIKYSIKLSPEIYKSMASLMVIDIATLIYFKIDIVMLPYFGVELDNVGFYTSGSRIMEGFILIHLPFATIFFRELRKLLNSPHEFSKLTSKLLGLSFVSPLLLIPIGWFWGREILSFCYGVEYAVGYKIFQLLIISLFFMIPNLVVTQGVLALDRESYYAWGACIAAIINVLLNYFLIPVYGAMGAATGTLITEGFLFFYIGIGLFYHLKNQMSYEQ